MEHFFHPQIRQRIYAKRRDWEQRREEGRGVEGEGEEKGERRRREREAGEGGESGGRRGEGRAGGKQKNEVLGYRALFQTSLDSYLLVGLGV